MKRFCIILFTALFLALFSSSYSFANGITVSTFGPAGIDTDNKTMTFRFNLNMYNSWRTGTNHDAAWVFMKAYNPTAGEWFHATLKKAGFNPEGTDNTGCAVDIIIPEDQKGMIVQRRESAGGVGAVRTDNSCTNGYLEFTWDYGADQARQAISYTFGSTWNWKLFGVEMVYVPEGSFTAMGSGQNFTVDTSAAAGGLGFAHIRHLIWQPSATPAGSAMYKIVGESWWQVLTSGAIRVEKIDIKANSEALADSTPFNVDQANGPYYIPAQYPKGFRPFYMMKHEISQGMYRDFLNTLNDAEAKGMCAGTASLRYCDSAGTYTTTVSIYRQVIRRITSSTAASTQRYGCNYDGNTSYDESTDGEWIAMNYLSWETLVGFLDWAALRPMSELEFEKAARGPAQESGNYYVWGSTATTGTTTSLGGAGTSAEVPNAGNMNFSSCSPDGPYRVGSYGSMGASRAEVGAGYYGALEMAGNVAELCVAVTDSQSRGFEGSHGDGEYSSTGTAKWGNPDWSDLTTPLLRGGGWPDAATSGLYHSRQNAASSTTRSSGYGGRGVRSAPLFIMNR